MGVTEKRLKMIDFVRGTNPEQICYYHGYEYTIEPEVFDATCELITSLPDLAIELINIEEDFFKGNPNSLHDTFDFNWCNEDGQVLAVLRASMPYKTLYYRGFWFTRENNHYVAKDKNQSLPHLLEVFEPFWSLYSDNRYNYFID